MASDSKEESPDLKTALEELYNKLESNQTDLEPEIQKVIDDNFWDLLVKS
jgi:hypothetical protein